MALIKTSALISDIRGKLNGSVFQRTQGGLTLRTKSGFTNSNKQSQQPVKLAIANTQAAYNALSQSDLDLWNVYATYRNKSQKRNLSLKLSGHALFLQEIMMRQVMQQSIPDLVGNVVITPVLQPVPNPILITDISIAAANLIVTLDQILDPTVNYLCLKISQPLSHSQASTTNKMKIIPFEQINSNTQNITTAWNSIYHGLPLFGSNLNFSIQTCLIDAVGISPAQQGRFEMP
jgi:multisubunit Na+/H+ antiporter MnhC subunit